jgi:hypothetical protein
MVDVVSETGGVGAASAGAAPASTGSRAASIVPPLPVPFAPASLFDVPPVELPEVLASVFAPPLPDAVPAVPPLPAVVAPPAPIESPPAPVETPPVPLETPPAPVETAPPPAPLEPPLSVEVVPGGAPPSLHATATPVSIDKIKTAGRERRMMGSLIDTSSSSTANRNSCGDAQVTRNGSTKWL